MFTGFDRFSHAGIDLVENPADDHREGHQSEVLDPENRCIGRTHIAVIDQLGYRRPQGGGNQREREAEQDDRRERDSGGEGNQCESHVADEHQDRTDHQHRRAFALVVEEPAEQWSQDHGPHREPAEDVRSLLVGDAQITFEHTRCETLERENRRIVEHAECRNANSIGIEMCVRKKNTKSMGATDKDWYFEDATVEAAAELTSYLMNKYGVPASHVIRHYDVTGKICPNPYVYNTSAHTWDEFKRKISGQAETPQGGNEKTIWNFLTGKGLNAYAVAGIMGNLYAESGLMPNNLQNTYNNKLGKTDAEYTAAVDNGSYGNFVKDSAGYGLAQWTYWSRKQALLNHAKQAGVSIADLNMQLGFLWEELQGYTAVMDALKKAGSVRAASDTVLTGYEKPADQSETAKKKRAEYGEGYYKKYAAGNGTKYYRVRKSWMDAASQLGAFTSLENAKSACKAGYTVYDDNGKAVYTTAGQQASAGVPFSVQVDILDLNIRTGAGTNYAKTGEKTGKGVFTIVEVKAGQGASAGWGRLKSGAGWISLDYATRLA